jgi:hypothetical protein
MMNCPGTSAPWTFIRHTARPPSVRLVSDDLPARWLTPDDLPGALDGDGAVDPFASMADPEHDGSAG